MPCPKCGTRDSWSDGGGTDIENSDKREAGFSIMYCMKCGYFEQERSEYILCKACEGRGYSSASSDTVSSGTMSRDELRRRITEDMLLVQGKDPSEVLNIPKEDWINPEDIEWEK